ncbi:hypothetical protein ACFRFU_47630 [Streptomyces sp. NPDC056704]|uniref:hypothetical protein n=1 Tax=Streptomyces TaxID=1883 RepID=UPI0036BB8D00
MVGKIIYLRQNHHVGPENIAIYLKRYRDVTISKSSVWRIRHRVQMVDVKFIEPLASVPQGRRGGRNKYFQFTAIDDCTRLRVLRIYPAPSQATAIQFLDYVIQRLPFQVEVIQTDNGADFQSAFHWHVIDKGIAHTYMPPCRRPDHIDGTGQALLVIIHDLAAAKRIADRIAVMYTARIVELADTTAFIPACLLLLCLDVSRPGQLPPDLRVDGSAGKLRAEDDNLP